MSKPDQGLAPLLLPNALGRAAMRSKDPGSPLGPYRPGAGSPSAPTATFRRARIALEVSSRSSPSRRTRCRAQSASTRPEGEPVHGAAKAVGQAHLRLPAEVRRCSREGGGAVADVAGPGSGVLRVDLDPEDRAELVEELQQRVHAAP